MVASRNQMHVMSRAFGSTPNGSLEAYGAAGEMHSYLNGRPQISLRGLGEVESKPDMAPVTPGEVVDRQEFATRMMGSGSTWVGVFVVRDSKGYYVVETINKKGAMVKGKYGSAEEAKSKANYLAYNLRNSGKDQSISGLGGLGASFGGVNIDTVVLSAATIMYIGADFPGARPILKQIARTFNEPKEAVQSTMLLGGLGVLMYRIVTQA